MTLGMSDSYSDSSSDGFSRFDLSEFTEEDFKQMDALVAQANDSSNATHSADSSLQYIQPGDLDFSELTADDFARIDDVIQEQPPGDAAEPLLKIQLEESRSDGKTTVSNKQIHQFRPKTPLARFRPTRILSVSDLVAPAWCEVQFDYGLHGMRSRPIKHRPTSFKSASGKKITSAPGVALQNDVTTKQGSAIHKELEREIRAEELKVKITTKEERWALRLVNMLSCLQSIQVEGYTREMPVFGLVHGEVVVGIVDELQVKEVVKPQYSFSKRGNTPSPKSKRARKSSPSLQPMFNIDQHSHDLQTNRSQSSTSLRSKRLKRSLNWQQFWKRLEAQIAHEVSSAQDNSLESSQNHDFTSLPGNTVCEIHLIDNKTRKSGSIPQFRDTISSRYQLMLYHRLLSDLISTSPPFDFQSYWDRLGVRSSKRFSAQFMEQAKLPSGDIESSRSSLDELTKAWEDTVKKMALTGVNQTLTLIYRHRLVQSFSVNKGKRKAPSPSTDTGDLLSLEDVDIGRAIENSLNDAKVLEASSAVFDESVKICCPMISESIQEAPETQVPLGSNKDAETEKDIPAIQNNGVNHSEIIGRQSFQYDEKSLDEHLTSILRWWRGQRKSEGVSLEDTWRCKTCEYCNDCEWREQMASKPQNVQG